MGGPHGFREIITPQAIDRTLREGIDVRALVDHDSSKIIGRLSAGTLRIRKERRGLAVEIDVANTTTGRDILESVSRGDVTGMSFQFETIDDTWELVDGTPLRTVTDMRVPEVSIVTFPAYPATDVSVAQRSWQRFQQDNWQAQLEMKRKWLKLRSA
jgi:HK97 family phage prohead protease